MATNYQELVFVVLPWMCRHVVFPFAKILHRIEIFEHFEGEHPMIIPVKFGKFTHIV